MKKALVLAIISSLIISGCARGISPYDAANGKARCGKTYIGR